MLLFFLLADLVCCSGVFNERGIESPLRVAQCRASCLEKFSDQGQDSDTQCLKGPDCYMCWENCELLHSNFPVWGAMCQERDICFPGCREACKFLNEAGSRIHQLQPVIHTKVESVVRVTDISLRWPRPTSAKPQTPLVYVVMRKPRHGTWRQIAQTVKHSTEMTIRDAEDAILRVLVVDSKGLLAVYSPSNGRKKKILITDVRNVTKIYDNDEWVLREVSLIHQRVLVIGEIAWDPKVKHGVYLVTWEVDGGGLRGNLFTDATCVTLSLWPDTIYHIQAELVSPIQGVSNLKSQIMNLDTSKAQIVSTDNDFSAASNSSFLESDSPQEKYEISSGIALAVLTSFPFILLIWGCRKWKWGRRLKPAMLDKPLESLKGFPPIVTVVTPTVMPSKELPINIAS